jgi:hypothetical protein
LLVSTGATTGIRIRVFAQEIRRRSQEESATGGPVTTTGYKAT